MGAGGLSEARLARLHDVMAGHVERGVLPGAVTLVCRRGEIVVDAVGYHTLGGDELRRDTLFRIASMSKPVTAVAAMILVEECRIRLDEPVDRFLPELADRRVLKRPDGPLAETVPANRPITLRDLLTFRWGFGQVFGDGNEPIAQALAEKLHGQGPPVPHLAPGPDEWIRRLGELPLMHQPGEKWLYHTGSDVLGVLIARVAGQPFEAFLAERVFGPLGMVDTAFSVPAEKIGRLATSYNFDQAAGSLEVNDEPVGGQWSSPPAFPSGGGGLVSTVDDYLAFGRMMLDNGRHGNERLLSRPTVETMTTDQLTPEQKAVSGFFPGYFDNLGWGFGLAVQTRRDSPHAVPGRYGWDGGLGTSWWADPKEEMLAILLTQRAGFPLFSEPYLDFWTSVYQSIDD
ncbi:serine hydrolase [Amycolatopsis sp.]|uniref:serine hydrolase domain-containing protein n=1 Tax=Amycolatopsis sp. TaxID=37632 RepID=UPI00261C2F05|nr:serine hydrolase domain-containing protein [Amycolatopsis sp.]